MMSVLFVLLTIFSYENMFTKGEDVKGVKDLPFIWFASYNEYYLENIFQRNCLIVFASTSLDVLLLTAFYRWARYSCTYRLVISSIMFYGARALCQ
jgi:hypothetical protein